MMFKVHISFKMVALSLIFLACATSNILSDIKDIIFTSQCTNACWAGVQPVITDKEQALYILTKRYGNENVTLEDLNNQQIFIHWVSDNQDLSNKGTVYLIENKVSEVSIIFKAGVNVERLIESIGTPNFVNGTIGAITSSHEFRCAGIELIYPELGLMASLSPYEESLGVYKSQQVTNLRIREPWNLEEIPWTDSFNIPWDGYREYCQMP
jgi:hypothetical protein